VIGGRFLSYGGQEVSHLIQVRKSDCSLVDSFSANAKPNGTVLALAIAQNTLYLAGQFDRYDGDRAQGIAAVDLGSGELKKTFSAAGGFANPVSPMALVASGNSLYVARGLSQCPLPGSPSGGLDAA
jgi:hypothetical protein